MIPKIRFVKTLSLVAAAILTSAGVVAAGETGQSSETQASSVVGSAVVEKAASKVHHDLTDIASTPDEEEEAADEAAEEAAEAAEIAAEAAEEAEEALEDEAPDDEAGEGKGPDVNGPAGHGLCNAYESRTKHDEPVAAEDLQAVADQLPPPFRNLIEAAIAEGQTVEEFCADKTPGKSADAPGQVHDKSDHGKPDADESDDKSDDDKTDDDDGPPGSDHGKPDKGNKDKSGGNPNKP